MCLNLGNGGPFGGRLPECHANPRATWSPHPDAVSAAVAGWSPRSKSRSVALWLWLNAMVYGRYNELVFMWFINQHSHHCGAPSCSDLILNITWVAKKITIQALYKKSLHVKENEGLDFLAAYMFCGKKYIYMRMVVTWRNWGTLEFWRLRNLDVCEGAPLRPCSISKHAGKLGCIILNT